MSIKFPLLQTDGRSHPQESLVYQNRLLCMPGGSGNVDMHVYAKSD